MKSTGATPRPSQIKAACQTETGAAGGLCGLAGRTLFGWSDPVAVLC